MLAVVTGGYSGLGLETTKGLAALGDTPGKITVDEMDLGDLASAAAFGQRVADGDRPVDILINNAAIMACPETRIGGQGQGWEAQLATNHFGHHVMTNTMWPALAAGGGARVVALSSTGHKRSDTAEEGAATSVWAATSPQLDGMGGVYCEDCDIAAPEDLDSPGGAFRGVKPYAVDAANAERLWAVTAEITGIDAFA